MKTDDEDPFVEDDEEDFRPLSPVEFMKVMANGTRLEQLRAMRDRVAQMLAYADAGPDVSSLALRLRQLLDDIDATPDPDRLPEHDSVPVDQLEALRAKRGSKEAPRRQGGRRRRSNR
jgi:hypothetical protein